MKRDPYNRIVHPAGWPLARATRAAVWLTNEFKLAGLRPHLQSCKRCQGWEAVRGWDGERLLIPAGTPAKWVLWCPPSHTPTLADRGACPRCDRWWQNPKRGVPVPWHELSDAHVLGIVGHLYELIDPVEKGATDAVNLIEGGARLIIMKPHVRPLSLAIAELRYRDLLPTTDELRVAFDLCSSRGQDSDDTGRLLPLPRIWARVALELRGRDG